MEVHTYYVHPDHLGTPQQLTDRHQQIVWEAVYEPFGQTTLHTERVFQPLRFPGQYADPETGLHQNWHRDYDPALGRYLQSDPFLYRQIPLTARVLPVMIVPKFLLVAPELLQTYGYANASPIVEKDVLGLWCGSGFIQEILIPDAPLGHDLSGACQAHDECYGTCGSDKGDCDFLLMDIAMQKCRQKQIGTIGCIAAAAIYYSAVTHYGQKAYDRAQRKCEGPQCKEGSK